MNKTPEEIQKSIEESRAKYNARKLADTIRRTTIKQGIKYIHDNKLEDNIIEFSVGEWLISVCYEKINTDTIHIAWCVKSPKDKYSFRKVKGLLGYRLDYHADYIDVRKNITDNGIQKAVTAHVISLIASEDTKNNGFSKKLVECFDSDESLDVIF